MGSCIQSICNIGEGSSEMPIHKHSMTSEADNMDIEVSKNTEAAEPEKGKQPKKVHNNHRIK